jgi:mono/diheme cytochrome c family protein
MRRKTNLGLMLIGCLIWSCSQSLYMPASTDANKQQQLLAGRKLYVNHCSNCHNLYLPKQFDASGWTKQLDEMQEKAKITTEEKQLIFEYLTSQP